METWESLVGPARETEEGQHYVSRWSSRRCIFLVGCLMQDAGGHGTVESSSVLAPSSHLPHFNVQRPSFYSQGRRQAMTTSGVALHRSIELWLQHAGQSCCSVYDRV